MDRSKFESFESLIKRLREFGMFTENEEKQIEDFFLDCDKDFENSAYIQYLKTFNTMTNKKFQPKVETRYLFYETSYSYSMDDKLEAVKRALTDPYLLETRTDQINPKFLLTPENIDKYRNFTPPKNKEMKSIENKSENAKKYHNPDL